MARFGSMMNMLMDNSKMPVPEVGMGATELCWSDRHAYTIVEIKSPKRIIVQQDHAKRTDNNGMSECQSYEFTPNPDAAKIELSLRKNGRWMPVGQGLKSGGSSFLIGSRQEYYDYSF